MKRILQLRIFAILLLFTTLISAQSLESKIIQNTERKDLSADFPLR